MQDLLLSEEYQVQLGLRPAQADLKDKNTCWDFSLEKTKELLLRVKSCTEDLAELDL